MEKLLPFIQVVQVFSSAASIRTGNTRAKLWETRKEDAEWIKRVEINAGPAVLPAVLFQT